MLFILGITDMVSPTTIPSPRPMNLATDKLMLQSVKFDDLCVNFKEHETLDASGVLVTATVASDGSISGMSLSYSDSAGLIPVTVPTDSVATVSDSILYWEYLEKIIQPQLLLWLLAGSAIRVWNGDTRVESFVERSSLHHLLTS